MLVLVILTSTSVGRSIFASGTSFMLTSRGPLYTSAFMLLTRFFVISGLKRNFHPWCEDTGCVTHILMKILAIALATD